MKLEVGCLNPRNAAHEHIRMKNNVTCDLQNIILGSEKHFSKVVN
jgi:hypothetical protein